MPRPDPSGTGGSGAGGPPAGRHGPLTVLRRAGVLAGFFLGAVIAVGSVVAVVFFAPIFAPVPIRWRSMLLFLPVPAFFLGGWIAGIATRRGWRAALAFGAGGLVPGYLIPTCLVGSQGASNPLDVFLSTVGIPAASYAIMGVAGGSSLGRSWRGPLWVGLGLALGALLGPGLHRIAAGMADAPVIPATWLALSMPWWIGALATALLLGAPAGLGLPPPSPVPYGTRRNRKNRVVPSAATSTGEAPPLGTGDQAAGASDSADSRT